MAWRRSGPRRSASALMMLLVIGAVVALGIVGCGSSETPPIVGSLPPVRPTLAEQYRPTGRMAAGDVFVHLFEWRWTDIATECETVLGPAGFHAVQVSPPQEHSDEPPDYPWSERYQPVSYAIDRSRSGTGAEFVSMVGRCQAVGVGIIVDAVINHMTNFPSPGVGSNGTSYSKYQYPGLYGAADFHPPCALTDYGSAANVQDCELFSLPDLNTGLASVRQTIADYLIRLARLGVAGFRIDAAKHIQQVELDDILGRMNRTLVAEGKPIPYLYLEIASGPGEALSERDYFGEGYASGGAADITEFTFTGVGNKFRKLAGERISELDPNGPPGAQFSPTAWGLIPSDKAVVFLQNHDTQHLCGLGYKDGDVFRLATVWMLAQPYGYPSILSSFGFDCPAGNAMGPPSDAGVTRPVSCAATLETAAIGQWVCEHRDPAIRAMVRFRRVVAGTAVEAWWSDGADAIAFSRGTKGFVAINDGTGAVSALVDSRLPAGSYCDRITGGVVGSSCAGRSVVVDGAGRIQLELPPRSALAIDVETKR